MDERQHAKWAFLIIFVAKLVIVTLCGSISIITAQKGIALLESKKTEYDELFKKQAEFNFTRAAQSDPVREARRSIVILS